MHGTSYRSLDVGKGAGRTFLDFPSRDIALGHRRRKRRHVEVLRCERRLARVESYIVVSSVVANPELVTAHLCERHGCGAVGSQCALTPYRLPRLKPWEPIGK
jgi:hypothetical protein